MFERFKRKAPKETKENFWTERDWNTRTVIHHVDHAMPSLLTVPGAYFQLDSSIEYAELEKTARQQLTAINISPEHSGAIFDQAVKLRTLQLQNKLLSERLYHYQCVVQNQTDAKLYLHQMEQRLADLKAAYTALDAERRQLLEQ